MAEPVKTYQEGWMRFRWNESSDQQLDRRKFNRSFNGANWAKSSLLLVTSFMLYRDCLRTFVTQSQMLEKQIVSGWTDETSLPLLLQRCCSDWGCVFSKQSWLDIKLIIASVAFDSGQGVIMLNSTVLGRCHTCNENISPHMACQIMPQPMYMVKLSNG